MPKSGFCVPHLPPFLKVVSGIDWLLMNSKLPCSQKLEAKIGSLNLVGPALMTGKPEKEDRTREMHINCRGRGGEGVWKEGEKEGGRRGGAHFSALQS
jgi:hypothetical protein